MSSLRDLPVANVSWHTNKTQTRHAPQTRLLYIANKASFGCKEAFFLSWPVFCFYNYFSYFCTAHYNGQPKQAYEDTSHRGNTATTNAHLLHKASKDGTYISGSLRVMGLSLVNALCADR